jgi:hypothetical protein
MGAQQVLRTFACCALIGAVGGTAVAAPRHRASAEHERVAIFDLGPADDGHARQKLGALVVAAGMERVSDDGLDDALAGISRDTDEATIAVEMSQAKQAFGELDCAAATTAARQAIGELAARQAAGLPVPELPRAWAYVLLCADRANDTGAALIAASRIRMLGGSPEVPANVMTKYPDVDAVADRDVFEVEISADVPGAALWVDFQPEGTAPAKLVLAAGEHVIAAASGTRRGFIAGTAVRKQKQVVIPMRDVAGKHADIAARVAGWHGKMPPPAELGAVLSEIHARVAFARHGDTVEVWGHAGLGEPLRRLGGDQDGVRSMNEADRAVALAVDRVRTWNDRAPDPDQPLLVESADERAHRRGDEVEKPTKWWVYAIIGGAVVGAAAIVYAKDSASDTQRVELHYP